MSASLPCAYCSRETSLNEPGAVYSKAGYDAAGEWNDESIVCAGCIKELDAWCEAESKRLVRASHGR